MRHQYLFFISACFLFSGLWTSKSNAQAAFSDGRLVHSSTTEVLPQGALELRLALRFGDMGGMNGGYENFYGLDELENLYVGLHYGLSSRIQLGLSRTKGTGAHRQLINGELKVNILQQSDSTGRMPISLTAAHTTTASMQLASNDPESMTYFEDFAHRLSFTSQLIVSRKYSKYFSVQALGGYQHRNIAPTEEGNGFYFAGIGARIGFSDRWGLVLDGTYPISDYRTRDNGYFPVLGAGLEYLRPNGDLFSLQLSNAGGLIENDFLPYSQSDFTQGELRLGLTFRKHFFQ